MKPLILLAVFSQHVWRGTYTVLEDILCFPFVKQFSFRVLLEYSKTQLEMAGSDKASP